MEDDIIIAEHDIDVTENKESVYCSESGICWFSMDVHSCNGDILIVTTIELWNGQHCVKARCLSWSKQNKEPVTKICHVYKEVLYLVKQ